MNVIFMGTPEFAVDSLMALVEKHKVCAVVCQPDKPNRRGNKTSFGAVKLAALNAGLETLQPDSLKSPEFVQKLASYRPDAIIVAAYGKLLPPDILKIPRYGCINVHASLLPKYRGAAPIQRAIIDGEPETGVTIMCMDSGLDTGDMLRKRHVVIEPEETYGELLKKLAVVGAEELLAALTDILSDSAVRIIQNDAEATYAPAIDKETERICWENSGSSIVNLVRALNPAPGAFCRYGERTLKIWRGELWGNADDNAPRGTVLEIIPNKGIIVNAAEEAVLITELQAEGGRKMAASDFLRGRRMDTGTLLT